MSGFGGVLTVKNKCAMLGLILGAAGCLETPPTYDGQVQLPPYIVMARVLPNPKDVSILVDRGRMNIKAPFRSEDLGTSLRAMFFVDSQFVTNQELGPSVFADEDRSVEENLNIEEGCHLVHLLLTHSDNINRNSTSASDESLAALVYWWVVVPTAEGEVHCPI